MAFEQREGQGSLFKNDEKQSEKHPDYRGSITINGQAMYLSAWIKTSKAGQKYMSLSAQPKEQKAREIPIGANFPPEPEFNDDIPF